MLPGKLRIDSRPDLKDGRMLLAFTGWMDGGEVSTGTVKRLVAELDAEPVAEIEPEGFYIYSFPGDMELSASIRPHIRIEDGIVREFLPPKNVFFSHEAKKLAFFVGREPNLSWREFGQCVFDFATELEIASIYFVGSFAGTVPHTREPRLHVSASTPRLKESLERYDLRPTNYEGPGSFMTYLITQAPEHGLEMANIAAEIPAYVQGTNPSSIEAVTRRLSAILELEVDLSKLRSASNEWESQVSEAIRKDASLSEHIRKLEEQYDDDLVDSGVDFPLNDDSAGRDQTASSDIDD